MLGTVHNPDGSSIHDYKKGGISGRDRNGDIKRHYEELRVGGKERTDDEKKVTKMNRRIMKLS